jgi:hypothetical protein
MTFIIKCDPFPVGAGQRGLASVKRYEGAAPEQGDQVFLWFAETAGGPGLAGRGLVHAVSDDDPADIAIVIEAAAPARALTKAHLAPHRDASDGGPLASLARKLFRHSLNKVAALDAQEAAFLTEHWDGRPASGSRYDPLRDWLLGQSGQELTLSFQEVEEILGSALPASATLPQWWANTAKAHTNVQREAWRAAAYDAFLMKDQAKVRFVKTASQGQEA